MQNKDFVAVDFETATASRMACQIGLVVVKDGKIVERVERFIQPPGNVYDEQTIAVHHITPDMTKDAPTFNHVWEDIKDYFIGTTLVAHNAQFDEDVLNRNLDYYGIMPMGIQRFLCTCNIYHRARLDVLCEAFGISKEGHHNALFDAECCAQFYLNYLNGVQPDYTKVPIDEPKYNRLKQKYAGGGHEILKGDVLKKDLSKANPDNPFYDRKVVVTGVFKQNRKELATILKNMGADINTSISKNTHFVLIGEEPGPAKIEKLDKLLHDGYAIRRIYQTDLDAILEGEYDHYKVDDAPKKDLDLTFSHFEGNHLSFDNQRNIIASKDLFCDCKGYRGDTNYFLQILGNLGAFCDKEIYPETTICLLSDRTLKNLQDGTKDETILYIEKLYNEAKSINFDFKFLSESDILDFCKERCERCGDDVTMDLYEKYMESGIKQLEKEEQQAVEKYHFKDGKNYCKHNGKIVLKLEDGRTWCPSRQFRGDTYKIDD